MEMAVVIGIPGKMLFLLGFLLFISGFDGGFANRQKIIKIQRGQTAMLLCHIDNESCGELHSVNWFKGDKRIAVIHGNDTNKNVIIIPQYADRVSVKTEAGPTTTLIINSVKISDEDFYNCDPTFFVPLDSCEATGGFRIELIVTVPPSEVIMLDEKGDRISNGSAVGPVQEGYTLTTTCVVKRTRPPPEIAWYRNRERITTHSPTLKEEEGDLYTASLDLSVELSRQDLLTQFECRVISDSLSHPVSQYFDLDLQVRPVNVSLLGADNDTTQGNRATITCESHGARPYVNVVWKNTSVEVVPDEEKGIEIETDHLIQADGTFITNSKLHFTASRFDNGKKFECEVENIVMRQLGEKPLHTFQLLDVMFEPLVEVSPTNMTVDVDIPVLLQCDYQANPATILSVKWYRNDVLLNLDDRDRYGGAKTDNVALQIKSTSREDRGNYTCELRNAVGTGVSPTKIELDVQYVPHVEILMIPDGPVKEHDEANVTLYCNIIDGNPANLLKVRWYANSTLLKELPDCNETSEDLCHIDPSKLLLENIGRGFFYNYSCEGYNTAGWGPRSTDKELVVYYVPGPATISHYPQIPKKRKSVTFSCSVDDPGYPEATKFNWFRAGNLPLSEVTTKDYTIDPVVLDTRTNISCQAVNEAGTGPMATVELNVYAEPTFITNLQKYSGVLHSQKDVSLTCRIECVPKCSIIWYKDNVKIDPKSDRYWIEESYLPSDPGTGDFESALSVLNFNLSGWPNQTFDIHNDNANYSCESSGNVAGPGVKGLTYFYVEYAPFNTTVSSEIVDVIENTIPARVQCNSEGHPSVKYNWTLKGEIYLHHQQTLKIEKPMTREDSDYYYCIAENKHGTETARTYINVQYKPGCNITRKEIDEEDVLICTSDGNPKETNFQWLYRSENDSVELGKGKVRGESSFLILEDFSIMRTYRCHVNNIVGNGFCQIEVAGHLAWWQRWDRTTLIILIASIAAVLIAVIIICIIIICICRRRRRQEKYHTDVSISATQSVLSYQPSSPLPTSTLQTTCEIPKSPPKWPLRPGVMVHVKRDTKKNLCANRTQITTNTTKTDTGDNKQLTTIPPKKVTTTTTLTTTIPANTPTTTPIKTPTTSITRSTVIATIESYPTHSSPTSTFETSIVEATAKTTSTAGSATTTTTTNITSPISLSSSVLSTTMITKSPIARIIASTASSPINQSRSIIIDRNNELNRSLQYYQQQQQQQQSPQIRTLRVNPTNISVVEMNNSTTPIGNQSIESRTTIATLKTPSDNRLRLDDINKIDNDIIDEKPPTLPRRNIINSKNSTNRSINDHSINSANELLPKKRKSQKTIVVGGGAGGNNSNNNNSNITNNNNNISDDDDDDDDDDDNENCNRNSSNNRKNSSGNRSGGGGAGGGDRVGETVVDDNSIGIGLFERIFNEIFIRERKTDNNKNTKKGKNSSKGFLKIFNNRKLFGRQRLERSDSIASNPFTIKHRIKGIRCSGTVVTYKKTPVLNHRQDSSLLVDSNRNALVVNPSKTTTTTTTTTQKCESESTKEIHAKSSTLRDPLTEPGEYENLPFHGLQTAPNKFTTTPINFNNTNVVRVAPRPKLTCNSQQYQQHQMQTQSLKQQHQQQQQQQQQHSPYSHTMTLSSNNSLKSIIGSGRMGSNNNNGGAGGGGGIVNLGIGVGVGGGLGVRKKGSEGLGIEIREGIGSTTTSGSLTRMKNLSNNQINYNLSNCFPTSYTEYYHKQQQQKQGATIPGNTINNASATVIKPFSNYPYTVESTSTGDIVSVNNPFIASNLKKYNTSNINRPGGGHRKKSTESDKKFYSLKSLGHKKGLHFCSMTKPSMSSSKKCKRHNSFAGSSIGDVVSGINDGNSNINLGNVGGGGGECGGANGGNGNCPSTPSSSLQYNNTRSSGNSSSIHGTLPNNSSLYATQTHQMIFYEPPLYENLTDSIQIHESIISEQNEDETPEKCLQYTPIPYKKQQQQLQQQQKQQQQSQQQQQQQQQHYYHHHHHHHHHQHKHKQMDDFNNVMEAERLSIYRSDSGISNSSFECITPIPAPRQLLSQKPHNSIKCKGGNPVYINIASGSGESGISSGLGIGSEIGGEIIDLGRGKSGNERQTNSSGNNCCEGTKISPSSATTTTTITHQFPLSYSIEKSPILSSMSNNPNCKGNNNNSNDSSNDFDAAANNSNQSNNIINRDKNHQQHQCHHQHQQQQHNLYHHHQHNHQQQQQQQQQRPSIINRRCKKRTQNSGSLLSLERSPHTNPFLAGNSSSSGCANGNSQNWVGNDGVDGVDSIGGSGGGTSFDNNTLLSSSSSLIRCQQHHQQQEQQQSSYHHHHHQQQQQQQQQQLLAPKELFPSSSSSSSSSSTTLSSSGSGVSYQISCNKNFIKQPSSIVQSTTTTTTSTVSTTLTSVIAATTSSLPSTTTSTPPSSTLSSLLTSMTNYNSDNSLINNSTTKSNNIQHNNKRKPSGYIIRPMKLPLRKHHSFHFQPPPTEIDSTKLKNKSPTTTTTTTASSSISTSENCKQKINLSGPLIFKPFLNEKTAFKPISPADTSNCSRDLIIGDCNTTQPTTTTTTRATPPPRICGTSLKRHMSNIESYDSTRYTTIPTGNSIKLNIDDELNSIEYYDDYDDDDEQKNNDDIDDIDDDDNDDEINEIIIRQNKDLPPSISSNNSSNTIINKRLIYADLASLSSSSSPPPPPPPPSSNNIRLYKNQSRNIFNSIIPIKSKTSKAATIKTNIGMGMNPNGCRIDDEFNDLEINSDNEQLRRHCNRLNPVTYPAHISKEFHNFSIGEFSSNDDGEIITIKKNPINTTITTTTITTTTTTTTTNATTILATPTKRTTQYATLKFNEPLGPANFADDLEYADVDYRSYGPINYKAASIYALTKKQKNGGLKDVK